MSVSDFGKATSSLQVSNLECMGHGASSTSGSIHASGNIVGRMIPYMTVQTGSTVTAYTVTTADVLGGIINHSANTSTLTLPAAAALVAAIPKCKVGLTLPLLICNTGAGTVTVAAAAASVVAPIDAGGALVGAAATIATTVHTLYWIRITNVTAGSQAYIAYRVSAA